MVFQRKKFNSISSSDNIAAKYRAAVVKHPFMLFGLPFLAFVVTGSFLLTPFTAIRYEKQDRKSHQLSSKEDAEKNIHRRTYDMREEYFRMMSKRDIDEWEPKRVKRLPGERDGRL